MKKFLLLVAMATMFIGVSAQNPYAYGLKATNVTNEGGTFAYSLNAPAQAVSLQFFNGEEVVATIDMPAEMIVAGDHSYNVTFADLNLPTGVELTWKVNVQGAEVSAPVEITDKIMKVYSPAGVAVDVDPESEYFGTMYMTESFASTDSKYFTAPANNAIGIGLYKMDPRFEVAKNEEGVYGFSCGLQSTGTTLVDWRPSRMHISDDGRMFILSQRRNTGYPLYELDRATMTATPLFEGTLDTNTGIVTNGETQVAAGVGVGFDVKGSGDDLQIVMMTCTPGTTSTPANYKTYEYNLGSATTWATAPSKRITAFDGKALNYSGINLCYDNNNGLWFSQYRYTPTLGEPSYMHANLAADTADVIDISVVSRNGGMAFNHDRTLMVRSEAFTKKLVFYQVGVGENNVPVLTKLYELDCPSFTGYNQLAFDYANNVIACDNTAEVFGMIQLPTDNPVVITPAAVKYNFSIAAPEPTKVYILGEVNGNSWNPSVGVEMTDQGDNSYTADITIGNTAKDESDTQYGYFSFTTKLSADANDWDGIAPYRFGAVSEASESNPNGDFWINPEHLGQNLSLTYQNGHSFRLAAGDYKLNVNLDEMTLVVYKKTYLKGDVDGNNVVDVTDVNTLVNIILGKDDAANYDGRANVDETGDVDVTDVNTVVNIILGK